MLPAPPESVKIVFGSAYVPEYSNKPPNVKTADWDIRFVRGKRTAAALGISSAMALGDPAVLVHTADLPEASAKRVISFMPHWVSMTYRGRWQEVCERAGVKLIDPRQSVDQVLTDILSSSILITEAMHGAIVADALRVPWIPVTPLEAKHRFKWLEWTELMGIPYQPHRLWPSTWTEFNIRGAASIMKRFPGANHLAEMLIDQSASHLTKIAAAKSPQLSEARDLDRVTSRILEQLDSLRRRYH